MQSAFAVNQKGSLKVVQETAISAERISEILAFKSKDTRIDVLTEEALNKLLKVYAIVRDMESTMSLDDTLEHLNDGVSALVSGRSVNFSYRVEDGEIEIEPAFDKHAGRVHDTLYDHQLLTRYLVRMFMEVIA